jgi:hypothetical protein
LFTAPLAKPNKLTETGVVPPAQLLLAVVMPNSVFIADTDI